MVQRVYEEPEFSEVLEKVPLEVRRSLTFEQRSAISAALRESRRNHGIDIRFVIPLFFTQFYVVFQTGKDRRRSTVEQMVDRRIDAVRWGMAGLLGVGGLTALVVGLVLAYLAKSRGGIDLIPNAHGSDVVKGLGIR